LQFCTAIIPIHYLRSGQKRNSQYLTTSCSRVWCPDHYTTMPH